MLIIDLKTNRNEGNIVFHNMKNGLNLERIISISDYAFSDNNPKPDFDSFKEDEIIPVLTDAEKDKEYFFPNGIYYGTLRMSKQGKLNYSKKPTIAENGFLWIITQNDIHVPELAKGIKVFHPEGTDIIIVRMSPNASFMSNKNIYFFDNSWNDNYLIKKSDPRLISDYKVSGAKDWASIINDVSSDIINYVEVNNEKMHNDENLFFSFAFDSFLTVNPKQGPKPVAPVEVHKTKKPPYKQAYLDVIPRHFTPVGSIPSFALDD